MKKRIFFILVMVLLFSFCFKNVSASGLCSSNGYNVFTINGILNDEVDAIKNRDKLKSKFRTTYNNQPLTVDYLYNPTHLGGIGDAIDAVEQGLFDQKSDYDLVEMLDDASQKVTTQKLLLVAHSQGNFYANNFYEKTASQPGGVPSQSIGVYGVATPADYVAGGGKYLTSDTDNVIASVVARFIEILSPNIHIPLNGSDGNGHSFSDVYLKYQSDRIISDIKSSLNKLKNNDEQEAQEPCISPPELTALHKVQGVALASADFAINTAKKMTDGVYNTGVAIGNTIRNVSLMINKTVKGLLANAVDSLPDASSVTTLPPDISASRNNNSSSEEQQEQKTTEETIITSEIAGNNPSQELPNENTTNNISQPAISNVIHGGGGSSSGNTEPIVDPILPESNAVTSVADIVDPILPESNVVTPVADIPEPTLPESNVATPVVDITSPVITILGNSTEVVAKNSIYNDAGATALDDVDGDLTLSIMKGGTFLNTASTGVYTITYTVADAAGNSATETRTIIVDDGAKLDRPNFVAVSGNYAYVVSDKSNSLEIIDISDPFMLVHKGSAVHRINGFELYTPKGIAISGDYAYVTSYNNALEVIDISNPFLPVHKNTLHTAENGMQLINPTFITISGNYAYIVGSGSQNVKIVDISDPINPVYVGSHWINSLTGPTSVFISENYMYMTFINIGSSGGGLQIVDISNPAIPAVVGIIYDGSGGATIANARSVFVSDNYAYVASRETKALEIIDVSDPAKPVHKGKLTSGFGNPTNFTPNFVTVSGNYAYITSYVGETLEIVDISDPANPIHKGSLKTGVGGAALSYPTSVFVSDNYAYISSSMSNALEVVDISDPANPIHINKIFNGEFNHTDPYIPVLSSAKQITAFDFTNESLNVIGVIDETNHTISLTVPFGTDVTALTPVIAISAKASIIPNNNLVQNFSNSITYTVTAENNSTQDYIVTVAVAPDSSLPLPPPPPSDPDPDTTPPVISSLSISSPSTRYNYVKIGDVITLSIIADAAGYTAQNIKINNVVATNFIDNGDGTYSATYTVSEGDNDVITSGAILVSVVLIDASENSNVAYTSVATNNFKIDAHAPTLLSAEVIAPLSIEVTFSEDIYGSTIDDSGAEFTVSGNEVVIAHESADGVVKLTLKTDLKTGETPSVTFSSPKFEDIAGNQAINPVTMVTTNSI